ncbi:S1/P1 nuclease [Bradyrhizobium sp. 2TAF24]|uniref:S1/P1 nuclease n=1 Tax=Bradyrhizobium sp. 2TAF24 TaxID=3233011 RepID=UPI003F91E732
MIGHIVRRLIVVAAVAVLAVSAAHDTAAAWGYQGHKVVGSIADRLLKDTNAGRKVGEILGTDLRTAGPWMDCLKAVRRDDNDNYAYTIDPEHLEYEVPCTKFKTPELRDEMVAFVKRNWFTCTYLPDGVHQRGCHETYHFDDVALQRGRFDRAFAGTNPHDLVAAINAAVAVLQGKPAPPPFAIASKREALFMLAHFLGDLHQPLHVGSVYLDAAGGRIDPDAAHPADPATETAGANFIQDENINLHREWDDIPTDLGEAATRELLADARSQPATPGSLDDWPAAWASDSITVAQQAFAGLTFTPGGAQRWTVTFDDHATYLRAQDAIKRKQLAKAGAHLAELLKAIWP